jgi:MOSC domain-containing protein YiiM
MKIVSTNLGKPVTFDWKGKKEQTGIFKYPIKKGLFIAKTDVRDDTVIDRVHHGGIHKACYLFSADHYAYWKKLYPNLKWNWGMFGENLTVSGLDESVMRIGDVYKIGEALVQVSQPREPCYKLGVRFGNQNIIQEFIKHNHPGTYVKILREGHVSVGDMVLLVEQSSNPLTVQQFYELIYNPEKNPEILGILMENSSVPQYKKDRFQKYMP